MGSTTAIPIPAPGIVGHAAPHWRALTNRSVEPSLTPIALNQMGFVPINSYRLHIGDPLRFGCHPQTSATIRVGTKWESRVVCFVVIGTHALKDLSRVGPQPNLVRQVTTILRFSVGF